VENASDQIGYSVAAHAGAPCGKCFGASATLAAQVSGA
jgi:hypothetical protein